MEELRLSIMDVVQIIIRIFLAVIIGGIIGYEREYTNSPAGFRTHILVAVGACIISLISVEMFMNSLAMVEKNELLASVVKVDLSRMGAQVVSGIGFLGAGTILHTKGSIRGLTTAASIWVVGCIGLAIGFGYYKICLIGGVATIIVLSIFKYIEKRLRWSKDVHKIYIEYIKRENVIESIEKYFMSKNVKIINLEFYVEDDIATSNRKSCIFTIKKTKRTEMTELILKCSSNDNIVKIHEVLE